jgi:glycosyltransferase involved in cell wall biosynthesis
LICGSRGYPARYGGFETLTQELCEYWNGAGIKVTVTGFFRKGGESSPIRNDQGIKVVNVEFSGWSRLTNLFATFKAMRIALSQDEFDGAIVLNDVNFFTAWFLQAGLGIPVIIHLDGDESARRGIPWPGRVLHQVLRLASIKFINQIVVDSSALLSKVPKRNLNKVSVIKYGFSSISTLKELVYRDYPELKSGYFLNIARFVPENNVAEIIEAYLDSNRQLPLVILGKGTGTKKYELKLENLARKAPGRIRLLEAEYDKKKVCSLIVESSLYIHGHEAGGTNPVLITARQYASFLASHDNSYNREGCRSDEEFWSSVTSLTNIINSKHSLGSSTYRATPPKLNSLSWAEIAGQYEELLVNIERE